MIHSVNGLNRMKTVFISNYYSPHQQPLADALAAHSDFSFICTKEMPEERILLGWEEKSPSYTLHIQDVAEKLVRERLMNADVVIAGSAPEKWLRARKAAGKLVFRYSERPLKQGIQPAKFLPRYLKWHLRIPRAKPIYLLCASAYAAWDYSRFGLFKNRCYKWGYFPPTRRYDEIDMLIQCKDPRRLLWCGRFLDWKHPDDAIYAVAGLRDSGVLFQLDLIGTGPMEAQLQEMIRELKLEEQVHLLGAMPPERVRDHMERVGIYLITSDRQEGWGAVVNEAMNSACTVISSHAVGSAPYLIRHGHDGIMYPYGNVAALTDRLAGLLKEPGRQAQLGKEAYRTITEEWNAETAATRLLALSQSILEGNTAPDLYPSGPCSRAEILRDDWFCGD